jgi:uncharacterized membrane protein YeaQ/YmgE (transglycosylase-associated protein family)
VAIGEFIVNIGIALPNIPGLTDLATYLSSRDLKTLILLFSLTGLVAGLFIRPRGASIVINLICGVVAAVLSGYLYMITIGSFYGAPASLAASVAGAVVALLIKRSFFTSGIQ